MILIEAGEQSAEAFEAKMLFVARLAARGHPAVLDDHWLPEGLQRTQRYDAAPYLRQLAGSELDRVILIGGEVIADETLQRLRQIGLPAAAPVVLIGRFESRQGRISAQSRLAYVLGREPEIVDLTEAQPAPLIRGQIAPSAGLTVPGTGAPATPDVRLFLPEAAAEDATALMALDQMPEMRLQVVLPRRAREHLQLLRHIPARLLGLAELPPAPGAHLPDIAVIFGKDAPPGRVAALAADMIASGRAVIDCTESYVLCGGTAPVLRGPRLLAALPDYLRRTVLPNRADIGRQMAASSWAEAHRVDAIERLAGLEAPAAAVQDTRPGRTIFLPTNGNGLGHARRCLLVASEFPATPVAFAAFPSCVPMIRAAGHDCLPLVPKSAVHGAEHANDLVNYMRLRRLLRPRDRLVFDGGFVFDSIQRVILEEGLEAAWLRRGLWQAGQINAESLYREGLFRRVIVPEEAFAELNAEMSFGSHVHHVGPVVGPHPEATPAAVRAELAARFGQEVRELVVTMLGGGVAADRTAHLQMLAALLERREKCLHLVLTWPGATVAPALYGWKNTRVCQSRAAERFAAAADLSVTAAGYNSFHEVLYHRLPAIFVPQMAGFMDDQERRARAASDRGLALTVRPGEMLLLEREVLSVLDGGQGAALRKALADARLPAPGNRRAAELISAEDWS